MIRGYKKLKVKAERPKRARGPRPRRNEGPGGQGAIR